MTIVNIHDLKKQQRLPIGLTKGGSPIPQTDDQHKSSKHHDKERYHKAFSFPVRRIAVDQSQFDGAILHLLGIKVQSIDSTADHSDFYHCGKQQTIKQQLQYDHCFSPLSLRANRASGIIAV